ncbi:MAG TPA: potassium channel family protein [Saprospiraceae bacterium]|nr:potassium channel family protein [Saprospiraceae bacterium]
MFLIRTLVSFIADKGYRELIFATIGVILTGTTVFHFAENWRWLDSLYFSVATMTTVGYGDFVPKTDLGKIFSVVYIILSVALILIFINTMFFHYQKIKKDALDNPLVRTKDYFKF